MHPSIHPALQPKHNAHGPAALVRLVAHPAVVREGGGLADGQLGVAHKEVDVDAQSGVADDFVAAFAGRVGGVLALPVKVRVIDPVVHVLVLVSPALFVERDQQDVRLFLGQHHMADIPIAGVEGLAKQRRNVFAHERFTERQIQWIDDVAQACERAHVVGGGPIWGLQLARPDLCNGSVSECHSRQPHLMR